MESPQTLNNRRVLLGIGGGIAAYKAAQLARDLQRAGCEVRVVMTAAATEFIAPMTLQALSGQPVYGDAVFRGGAVDAMEHIELARWADVLVIAPATADLLARLAQGRADDLLAATVLATAAAVALAPAMNQAMWSHAQTQANCRSLRDTGFVLLGPDDGSQACGETGPGRMWEPQQILQGLAKMLGSSALGGERVLITAGPTREPLDPVRYLSNRSSGRMGFALAQAAADLGGRVCLISGPVALSSPDRVQRIDVETARQMQDAVMEQIAGVTLFIGAAAVADYRVADPAGNKLKKQPGQQSMHLELVRNPDILHAVATASPRPARVVGFAAETENLLENARAKLHAKEVDYIVANDVSRSDIAFDSEYNEVELVGRDGEHSFAIASKYSLARQLLLKLCGQS